ncbi:MAG TPA: Xaa-Pro peptidase family protein [Dongiaceae bacterium]|nr:Xaa-Pro peptidase family protein [Dongiaceae bacterium]
MISRRKFLESGAASAGLAALARPLSTTSQDAELPASIAALKSRKNEAVPIMREERAKRQERARKLMAENSLAAIVVSAGTSLQYFSGVRWWGSERMFAMVLPAKGNAFFVCPAFEEGRARKQIAHGPDGEHADVRTWQEDESPYQKFAQGLEDRGLATAKIGIEETMRYVFVEGMSKAAARAHFASATAVTAGCRMIKSEHEIALMRLASQCTLAAYEAAFRAVKDGMTQAELEQLVDKAHEQQGFSGYVDVQVGEFSAFPHGSLTPQVVHEGTIVLMDGGCVAEGYQSDITRTFVLGKASDKMKSVFEIVHRAQSAALGAARPGAECGSVDAAARKVVVDGGYGPDYKYFTHRLGHGLGMDGHEWPYLVRGNPEKLQANMTTSNEPGIYIRGEFGIRLEDDMHITENGAELFTPQSPSLEDPFGKA